VAEEMKLTAEDLLQLEIIDRIIQEPQDGAHESFHTIAKHLKEEIETELKKLKEQDLQELLENRYQRYRKFY
ncbi:MAG: acetyl-CoA carboxylase carboxyl transferase subunit alpha, partial [Vallitaleaceae bacterium]|nr:acetyl-CoA carboxylase carboxyl transferase subunit alpha [Vallitaleaceae bacterium]